MPLQITDLIHHHNAIHRLDFTHLGILSSSSIRILWEMEQIPWESQHWFVVSASDNEVLCSSAVAKSK